MVSDFASEVDKAYKKGIGTPQFQKAISEIKYELESFGEKTVPNVDRNKIEKFISKSKEER